MSTHWTVQQEKTHDGVPYTVRIADGRVNANGGMSRRDADHLAMDLAAAVCAALGLDVEVCAFVSRGSGTKRWNLVRRSNRHPKGWKWRRKT